MVPGHMQALEQAVRSLLCFRTQLNCHQTLEAFPELPCPLGMNALLSPGPRAKGDVLRSTLASLSLPAPAHHVTENRDRVVST